MLRNIVYTLIVHTFQHKNPNVTVLFINQSLPPEKWNLTQRKNKITLHNYLSDINVVFKLLARACSETKIKNFSRVHLQM